MIEKEIGLSNGLLDKLINGNNPHKKTLKKIENYLDNLDKKQIDTISEVKESSDNYKTVPYVGQEITATAGKAMSDALAISDETYVRLPMFTKAEYILPVRGHSMKGYIDNGDFIAVRRITNINRIIYGEPYVVITKETEMRTVKFINENKDDTKSLWLSPYNTEQFTSQSILKEDIESIYVVLGKLKDLNV